MLCISIYLRAGIEDTTVLLIVLRLMFGFKWLMVEGMDLDFLRWFNLVRLFWLIFHLLEALARQDCVLKETNWPSPECPGEENIDAILDSA